MEEGSRGLEEGPSLSWSTLRPRDRSFSSPRIFPLASFPLLLLPLLHNHHIRNGHTAILVQYLPCVVRIATWCGFRRVSARPAVAWFFGCFLLSAAQERSATIGSRHGGLARQTWAISRNFINRNPLPPQAICAGSNEHGENDSPILSRPPSALTACCRPVPATIYDQTTTTNNHDHEPRTTTAATTTASAHIQAPPDRKRDAHLRQGEETATHTDHSFTTQRSSMQIIIPSPSRVKTSRNKQLHTLHPPASICHRRPAFASPVQHRHYLQHRQRTATICRVAQPKRNKTSHCVLRCPPPYWPTRRS